MKRILTGLVLTLVSLGIVLIPSFNTLLFITSYSEEITEIDKAMGTFQEEEKKKSKTIIATINIHPGRLNCKSKGKWILAYISLPPPYEYDVNEININTISLNQIIVPEMRPCSIKVINNDNIPELMVKFDRSTLIDLLEPQQFCQIEITGKLCNGIKFKGNCAIELIHYS
ncbi:MAG: hypothetical protein ACFFA2_06350 [Promethearchaeota archaeon]